jgi:broad specificity phosphatase PhoE
VRTPAVAVIILIRHGQTTSNAARLLVGQSDPALTELGERQAMALRPYLRGVVEVWTSPLQRARRTAALALPDTPALVKESFIEVNYGSLDGQSLSLVTEEQWRAFEHDHNTAFGDGESLASVDQRVHVTHAHLAIVSHMSPIKSAMTWALGVSGSVAWRMNLSNGSITTIGSRMWTPSLRNYNVVPPLED